MHLGRGLMAESSKEFPTPVKDVWQISEGMRMLSLRLPLFTCIAMLNFSVISNGYGNDIIGKSAYRGIPPSSSINDIIAGVIENHLGDNNTVYPSSTARGSIDQCVTRVAKCAYAPEEALVSRKLQKAVRQICLDLLEGEVCMRIDVCLSTIPDKSTLVGELGN